MMFVKNPWIDPRVERLGMMQIETYLRKHGWRESTREITRMRAFRDTDMNGVFLPDTDDDEFLRYAIDAVECLARAENRYAGDVLTDLLAQPTDAKANPAPATPPTKTELVQPVNR